MHSLHRGRNLRPRPRISNKPIIRAWLLKQQVVSMGLPASRMRFIALSATLPNAYDFGSFLGAEIFTFGDKFRPVSLQVRRAKRD